MTINGYGFEGNVTATIDGQECVITSNSMYSLSCAVQPKDTPSLVNVSQMGSNGLTREMYNFTDDFGNENN